jgi:hypothetical protein
MPPRFQTPRTALAWATLDEWLACAWTIERRRHSRLSNVQAALHIRALPVSVVYQSACRTTLTGCDRLLRCGGTRFCQPPRGRRRDAPQTALIVAIANRLSQLDRAEDHASISPGHNGWNSPHTQTAKPRCPHRHAQAMPAYCHRCGREMCVECITYGVREYAQVCGLCADEVMSNSQPPD